MNAKHQTKNALSHKLVFLAAAIAIAIVAAFSICATSEAKADEQNTKNSVSDFNGHIFGNGGDIYKPGDGLVGTGENGQDLGDFIFSISSDYEQISCIYLGQNNNPESNGFVNLCINVYTEVPYTIDDYFYFTANQESESDLWTGNKSDEYIPIGSEWDDGIYIPVSDSPQYVSVSDSPQYETLNFYAPGFSSDVNISGHVSDANDFWQPVPGAFVQYCQWNPWFWDYVPVPEMSTFTDWFGNYTIEGVTEDILPGVIRVFRGGYEVGESAPIWFVPDGLDTIYRFVEMTPVHHIDLADVEINGGPHHVNFVTTYELVKDGKVVESDGGTFNKIEYKVPVGSSYAVYDDGTLHSSYAFDENGTLSSVAYTVKAIAEEGYTLDKGNINGEDLVPGKDYILKANDVMGLASYKLAEQPVPPVPPTPGPTPVNPGGGTAQTGDATPLAAVAVLAIVAALGCGVALRKEY